LTTANRVRLGDVLEVQSGFAFKKEFFTNQEGVPLIRIRDLDAEDTETKYNGPYREEFLVSRGDFLIGMDGEFRCHIWKGPKSLLNQRVCRLRNFASSIVPMYLYYGIQRYLSTIEAQTAFVTVKHISGRQIEEIEMPLPAVDDQQRIVDLLSRAENIVRMRREAEARAKEIIPALFLDMFGDPATNPKGWPVRTLGELARIIGGSSLPKGDPFAGQEGGDLLVKVSDMNRAGNEVQLSHSAEWTEQSTRSYSRVPAGAIVLPKRGAAIATNKKRLTTRSALLDPNLMGIVPREDTLNRQYLFQWFVRFDLASITSGTTVPQLNKGDLAPLLIAVPPLSLQTKFAEQAVRIGALVKSARAAGGMAEQAFQSLLAGVFSERWA
jgi:type I restriction enzyme S subunit